MLCVMSVKWGTVRAMDYWSSIVTIEDENFHAEFDGKRWTVVYYLKGESHSEKQSELL